MRLFPGVPDDPEDNTVMEMDGANALYSAVKSSMDAIRTEDEDDEQDAVHWIINIAKPLAIRRLSESKLPNGKSLVQIPKENANFPDPEWTEDEQVKLKTLV